MVGQATEQFFSMVLFMPNKVVLTFQFVDEILKRSHSMKVTEQYFPVVLVIKLYNLVPTFESVGETLN